MPIAWEDDVIQRFFGTLPFASDIEEQKHRMSFVDYVGKHLRYSLVMHRDDELVMISGDISHPFGADSLFEITVPCDSITEIPDGYYHGNTGLGFWYGDTNQKHNMTMMLLKSPNGDLKVWPNAVWPERHAYYKMLAIEYTGKRFDRHP